MVCPRRLSFSPFVVLMSTTNGEKDSLLGQTVLPPELVHILGGLVFFYTPFRGVLEMDQSSRHIGVRVVPDLRRCNGSFSLIAFDYKCECVAKLVLLRYWHSNSKNLFVNSFVSSHGRECSVATVTVTS